MSAKKKLTASPASDLFTLTSWLMATSENYGDAVPPDLRAAIDLVCEAATEYADGGSVKPHVARMYALTGGEN